MRRKLERKWQEAEAESKCRRVIYGFRDAKWWSVPHITGWSVRLVSFATQGVAFGSCSRNMGCELSKLATTKSRNQAGNDDSSPPPPAATDPRLPLTARQKFTVIASWKAVSRALEPTGIYMFIRYVKPSLMSRTFYDSLATKTFERTYDAWTIVSSRAINENTIYIHISCSR